MENRSFVSLIGVPYEEMHCWELVRSFYLKVYDIELKHYWDGELPDKKEIESLITTNKGEFYEVDKPEFGDIILLKVKGLENHIGVFLGRDTFLHTHEKAGSVIDRLHRWEKLIVGYYRVKKADNDKT